MELKQKQLFGNIFLSFLTVIFFFSLIYLLSLLSYGSVVYIGIVVDFVLFVSIVYVTCKTCGISIQYEKNSRLGRMIPYLIFLAIMVNISGLLSLTPITFLGHFIQIIVISLIFGVFIFVERRL
jgi:hypothetical protein